MAKLEITTTTNTLKFVTNEYATAFGMDKSVWNIKDIQSVKLINRPTSYVEVSFLTSTKFAFTFDGATGTEVETVNGVAPVSNSDLFDKLVTAIG